MYQNRGACSCGTYEGDAKLKEEDHWEYLGIDMGVILGRILK